MNLVEIFVTYLLGLLVVCMTPVLILGCTYLVKEIWKDLKNGR